MNIATPLALLGIIKTSRSYILIAFDSFSPKSYGGRVGPRVGSGQTFCQQSRVGSGQRFAGSGRVGSKKSDPWTTLSQLIIFFKPIDGFNIVES